MPTTEQVPYLMREEPARLFLRGRLEAWAANYGERHRDRVAGQVWLSRAAPSLVQSDANALLGAAGARVPLRLREGRSVRPRGVFDADGAVAVKKRRALEATPDSKKAKRREEEAHHARVRSAKRKSAAVLLRLKR